MSLLQVSTQPEITLDHNTDLPDVKGIVEDIFRYEIYFLYMTLTYKGYNRLSIINCIVRPSGTAGSMMPRIYMLFQPIFAAII
jgi:hypothetical protein